VFTYWIRHCDPVTGILIWEKRSREPNGFVLLVNDAQLNIALSRRAAPSATGHYIPKGLRANLKEALLSRNWTWQDKGFYLGF